MIADDSFSSTKILSTHSKNNQDIPSAINFKKIIFPFKSELILRDNNWKDFPTDFCEDIIFFLAKYVLTKKDFVQLFNCDSRWEICAPLEQLQRQEIIRDIQRVPFSTKLSDELIRLAFQWNKVERYLNTGESEFALIQDPEESTIKNIRLLAFRTIEYLNNIFQENIPNFVSESKNKDFVIFQKNLIYLSSDSKNFLSEEIIQKIYSFYSESLRNQVEKLIIFNPRFNAEYSLNLNKYLD